MSDKSHRRFEKLKKRYEGARRRAQEKGVASVADILASGPSALMSPAGREAIDAELKAMKAERRALRKLQILAGESLAAAKADEDRPAPQPRQVEQEPVDPKPAKATPSKVKSAPPNPETPAKAAASPARKQPAAKPSAARAPAAATAKTPRRKAPARPRGESAATKSPAPEPS